MDTPFLFDTCLKTSHNDKRKGLAPMLPFQNHPTYGQCTIQSPSETFTNQITQAILTEHPDIRVTPTPTIIRAERLYDQPDALYGCSFSVSLQSGDILHKIEKTIRRVRKDNHYNMYDAYTLTIRLDVAIAKQKKEKPIHVKLSNKGLRIKVQKCHRPKPPKKKKTS